MASSSITILCIALTLCIVMKISSATEYKVGDSGGWGLGTDYSTWANDKTFLVGDSLVFNYDGSTHSVAEVGSSDYNGCSTANALSSSSSGATTIQLKTAGTHYFVCGVGFHCSSGMKLAITVKPSSGSVASDSPPTSAGTTNTNTPTSHVPDSSMSIVSMPSLFVVAIAYALLVIIMPMP